MKLTHLALLPAGGLAFSAGALSSSRVALPLRQHASRLNFSGPRVRSLSMSSAFRGPMQEQVEEKLAQALEPTHLEVMNESHGRLEDESHFKVVVVSDKFEGTQETLGLPTGTRARPRDPKRHQPTPSHCVVERSTLTCFFPVAGLNVGKRVQGEKLGKNLS